MTPNDEPLVHIGYHKTGTTWLQRFLFDNEAVGFGSPFAVAEVSKLIAGPNELDFDATETRSVLKEGIDRVVTAGLYPAFSSERLSGNPHSGGYDSFVMAHRLHELFPQARVFMVIRRQPDAIVSSYKQYVAKGGRCSFTGYVQAPRDGRVPLFDFDHFTYHRLIELYIELFGPDHILVLPYEEFRESGRAFISRITNFAGLPAPPDDLPYTTRVNIGLSLVATTVRRHLNVFTARRRGTSINPQAIRWSATRPLFAGLDWLDARSPAAIHRAGMKRRTKQVADLIGDRYVESNRIVAKLADLDLASLGYDM